VDGFTALVPGFLDTGSSGTVVLPDEAAALGLGTLPGVTFADVGVGGPDDFAVSESVIFHLAHNPNADLFDEGAYDYIVGPANAQVGPLSFIHSDLGQLLPPAIYGMPVMQNKVVVIDPKPLNALLSGDIFDGDIGSLSTYLYDPATPFHPATQSTDPGIPTVSHHVPLSYGDFSRFTTIDPEGATRPDLADNPIIGPNPVAQFDGDFSDDTPPVHVTFGGHTSSGSFLLDTGAQASFISTRVAEDVHVRYVDGTFGTDSPLLEIFDPNDPGAEPLELTNQFRLQILGIGGEVTVSGFFLDEMILHTLEGSLALDDPNNIRYLGAPVLVADIGVVDAEGTPLILDGVFGMNFLVASLFVDGFNFGNSALGPYGWITFDQPNGILGLEPIQQVPEPGTLALAGMGAVALASYAWRRRKRARR
jgi:hypothetical protein